MRVSASLFNEILPIDASILIPVVLLVLAVCFGLRSKKNIMDLFVVGVSICLIYALTISFSSMLTELSRLVSVTLNMSAEYIDIAPATLSRLSSFMKTAGMSLAVFIVSNIVLLLVGAVRTLVLDFWTVWMCVFAGGMAEYITSSPVYGTIIMVVFCIVSIVLSDMTRNKFSTNLNTGGMGVSNIAALSIAPICAFFDFIHKKLPEKFQKDFYITNILEKYRYFAPVTVFVYITVVALLCSVGFVQALELGINMAALVFILPILMKYIIDSLFPLISTIEKVSTEKLSMTSPLSISLPDYCFFGSESVLLISVIIAPIYLILTKMDLPH